MDSDVGQAIVELFEEFEAELQSKESTVVDVSVVKNNEPKLMYNKRAGTSGIKGQLYESKLLSLVLVRASIMKEFDEFYLGTCLNGIGAFDDLCIKYLQNESEGVVFLKAKYTSDGSKVKLTLKDFWKADGDFSLHKYFKSYLTIIQKLRTSNGTDALINIKTGNVNCTFAIYTTAEIDFKDKMFIDVDSVDQTARDLICSGDNSNIYRYKYNEEDIAMLTNTALIDHMTCIGKTLTWCICTGNSNMLFNDSCIRKFHVVLAHQVLKVSEITEGGYRIGNFKKEFFYNYDSNLVHLK